MSDGVYKGEESEAAGRFGGRYLSQGGVCGGNGGDVSDGRRSSGREVVTRSVGFS